MKAFPPHVDLARQRAGTRILLETTVGVWALKLTDPVNLLVEVMSTDPRFSHSARPCVGQFIESSDPKAFGPCFESGKIVKGWMFSIRFADVVLIAEPVQSLKIEGDDWSYEIT
jgi:hypothetical protein